MRLVSKFDLEQQGRDDYKKFSATEENSIRENAILGAHFAVEEIKLARENMLFFRRTRL